MNFRFKAFQESDLLLMVRWLAEPHVKEFWKEPEDESELRAKYLGKLQQRRVHPFIIFGDERAIGYIQFYNASEVGGGWWPDVAPGTYGIDQFIGEPALIGKGLGPRIITGFIATVRSLVPVKVIIADPDPKNTKAIRAYIKSGFWPSCEIKTPNGKALLMTYEATSNSFDLHVAESLRYLSSTQALQSLEADVYSPKWNSPWWHMSLLNEMGFAKQIPAPALEKMVEKLKVGPIKIFPIHPGDIPEGYELSQGTHCHCALGNIYQALSAAGIDVDQELPWIRSWFLRYQLPDGGLNCDNDAYLKDSPPSSMVGTIAPLEAVLFHTNRPWTVEEVRFLDQGAQCLIGRKLMHATSNPLNIEEKDDEPDWLKLCFPRFYLYDVLRGLNFILNWADKRKMPLPLLSIHPVIEHIRNRFPDGMVKVERHCYEGVQTRIQSSAGKWESPRPASFFPLLENVSLLGAVSSFLSRQWQDALALMTRLKQQGLLKK